MVLLIERIRVARMRFQFVDALADFGKFFRRKFDKNIAIEGRPCFSAVARAERARSGDADDQAAFAEALNGMHHHAASSRAPFFASRVIAQTGNHFPIRSVVAALEEHAGISSEINDTGFIGRAWSDVPDALERGIRLIFELHSFFGDLPGFASDALDLQPFFGDLPGFAVVAADVKVGTKPSVANSSVVALRIARILRNMVDFLAGEKRTSAIPFLAIF